MVKEYVEESPHDHLLPAASYAPVEWRPHDKPGGVVGRTYEGDLQKCAAIQVDLSLVLEADHFVLGELVVVNDLHPLLEVVVADTQVGLARVGCCREQVPFRHILPSVVPCTLLLGTLPLSHSCYQLLLA